MLKYLLCSAFICILIQKNAAVTHWVVTESGRIQAYLESPFEMRRPYDLLALLDQEKRNKDVNLLFNELISRKAAIEKKSALVEGSTNLSKKITSVDPDCVAAGKDFTDIEFYSEMFTNGSNRADIILSKSKKDTLIPECEKFSLDLKTKIKMESNNNITIQPEKELEKALPGISVKEFGHSIAEALKKNGTSWIHYNLAAIYWRILGDGPKAINCIKRSIAFVPMEFQDIPLHNLAGVLHKAGHSKEAILFLLNAAEAAPKEPLHYMALARVYGSMGQYNMSVIYYDKYLKLNPDDKEALSNKHATLCYWRLTNSLISFEASLQRILDDLHDYHSKQQQWLRLQERLMWEHASLDLQLDGFHGGSSRKIQRCMQVTSEGKPIISCDFYKEDAQTELLNVQSLFNYVEKEQIKVREEMEKNEKVQNKKKEGLEKNGSSPPVLYPKYPTSMPTANNKFFDVTGWPNKEDCLNWNLPLNDPDDLNIPVYLPLENKGIQVDKILGEYIGLGKGEQHPLPWHPPVCELPSGDNYLTTEQKKALNSQVINNDYLRRQLLSYVNNGQADEAEIGQRIVTAMEKKSAPQWVLATLASLYWRVRGNGKRALDCLDNAYQALPKKPTDVVLVSIASIIQQIGFNDKALYITSLAFKDNYIEPSTNFLLALIHYGSNNPLLAMYYMKNALRVDINYYEGRAETLLKTWACRIKLGSYAGAQQVSDKVPEGMCIRKEETFEGRGLLCNSNGEHCKTAQMQCYRASKDEPAKQECSKEGCQYQEVMVSPLFGGSSGDVEPDQSKLERIDESSSKDSYGMQLGIGEDHQVHIAGLGDFYVSVALDEDPSQENLLHVYDKYGTYSLSPSGCKVLKINQEIKYASVWSSISTRSIDISLYFPPGAKPHKETLKPYCPSVEPSDHTLEHLSAMVLRKRLPSSPDKDLVQLLGLMARQKKLTLRDFGATLGLALQTQKTSWILATAAGYYWRSVGNSEEAVTCLRLALTHVPNEFRDIPLISLANLLNRVGFHGDALEVAQNAIKINKNFVMNNFALGNIHISLGEYEKAVNYFRTCLKLDRNFVLARWKLQALLCTMLFEDGVAHKGKIQKKEE